MSNPCVKDLDAGQLDFMWNFLKFKGKDLSIHDIKGIKDNLDAIRQLMIQKTGGQENYKKSYELDINDLNSKREYREAKSDDEKVSISGIFDQFGC